MEEGGRTPETSPPAGKTEAEREKIKLGATYLNGIAVGFLLIGGLSIPTTTLLTASDGGMVVVALVLGAFCLGASPILHLFAKRSLEELDR